MTGILVHSRLYPKSQNLFATRLPTAFFELSIFPPSAENMSHGYTARATWALEVPPGEILVPADKDLQFPVTV